MNPQVTAIILNWNGMSFIHECIDSFQKQNYQNLRVIFVDNGSTDNSLDYVRNHFPWVEMILLHKNQGFEIPNNLAMKIALSGGADYIFLANNDIILEENAISELVKIGESSKSIGALGPVQVRYDDPTNVISAGGDFDWKRGILIHYKDKPLHNNEVCFLSGAAFIIKKQVIECVGMLDEDYYFYGEDVDLSTRIIKNRYKLVCVTSSIVRHHAEGSSSETAFRIYHMTRTRLILMHKHASITNWLYFVPFFIKNTVIGDLLWLIRQDRKSDATAIINAIIDFFKHRMRSTYAEPLTQGKCHYTNL
jgi:GT2 family glycosyltransferase